ncbi:MAG: hypothetical protein ABW252_13405 [Polyangiales bacterium]
MCMDSQSGPELPHKVHGFREPVKRPSPKMPSRRDGLKSAIAFAALSAVAGAGCGGDPTRIEGAVSRAASAVASHDHAELFSLIDERARFSLASVHHARRQAAGIIRAEYPAEGREAALAELGDAALAETAVDLFRRRCPAACVAALGAPLAAPRTVSEQGDVTIVDTVRDTRITLHRGKDGRYGLVWQTDALIRERSRAAAELDLIQKNARAYQAQRALRSAAP